MESKATFQTGGPTSSSKLPLLTFSWASKLDIIVAYPKFASFTTYTTKTIEVFVKGAIILLIEKLCLNYTVTKSKDKATMASFE